MPTPTPNPTANHAKPAPTWLPSSPTVAFYTLGCKTNQLESATLAGTFKKNGWQVVDLDDSASVVVINSCTVTERSDTETQRVIRRAKLANPASRIVVTGCYAQVAPEEVAAQPGVTDVIGNHFKGDLYQLITQGPPEASPHIHVAEIDKSRMMEGGMESGLDRTRGSLKIQDGCDYKCTYCIIWEARGLSRSLPVADLKTQLTEMMDAGFVEMMLTGINIGQYQCPDTGTDLAGLLNELCAMDGDFRLRLTSLDPMEVTDELIAAMANNQPKICPHVHLSAQSAEDFVLKRMGRRHHVADMVTVCEKLTTAMPNVAIASDIIVGFPGETDERFEHTRQVLADCPMHTLHVFSYSKRKGTPAADFPDQVPEPEKKRRAQVLRDLAADKWLAYRQQFIGQPLTIVVENDGAKGMSENYIRCQLTEPRPERAGQAVIVQPHLLDADRTIVELV